MVNDWWNFIDLYRFSMRFCIFEMYEGSNYAILILFIIGNWSNFIDSLLSHADH